MFEPSRGRQCTFNSFFFGLTYWAKHSGDVPLPQPASVAGVYGLDLLIAMCAGFLSTFPKMPFDVAKSRIQNQPLPPPGEPRKYRNTLQCLATIRREEGVGAWYKGLRPTIARMALGQGVAFASFELALDRLRRLG